MFYGVIQKLKMARIFQDRQATAYLSAHRRIYYQGAPVYHVTYDVIGPGGVVKAPCSSARSGVG